MLRRAARLALLSILAIAGAVLLFQMFAAHPPLNAEGWFGVALTALLAIGSEGDAAAKSPASRFRVPPFAIAAGLIGLTTLALWPVVHLYFLSDDFILVRIAHSFPYALRPIFATIGSDGFFRPVGYLSLAVTSLWAGVNPVAWHATALALHAANVVLVGLLASRLGASPLASGFAAVLFAVHGTRPEAAAWIAGRFDLLATFFVLAGLLFFLHEPSSITSRLASLFCMVPAILTKESAYVFPLLLALFVIVRRDRSRIPSLIPFFATTAALFAYRLWLFSGVGGYRDVHNGTSQVITFGLSTVKTLVLRIWMALYFPINWSVAPSAWFAILMAAYLAALIWVALSRPNRALVTFATGFILVSILPPLHLLGIGAGLANSRLLYLPSVGFCLLLAFAADAMSGRARWVVPAVVLVFHFAALRINLQDWEYASLKARSACVVAAKCDLSASPLPGSLRAVPFFANGLKDCIELQRTVSPATDEPAGSLIWDAATSEARCDPSLR